MNNIHKLINTLGVEPPVAIAVLAFLSIFVIIVTILYICVPFFLLRIRKEIISCIQMSKVHTEPVEGKFVALKAQNRSKAPFDKLRVLSR